MLASGETDVEEFKRRIKFVISGGLEGTKGHERVVKEMHEARALRRFARNEALVVVLLEPDDYTRDVKGREPLVFLDERSKIWSTSGLVDGVARLPVRCSGVSKKEHYSEVHDHIAPAEWCASVENPACIEIVTRHGEDVLDPSRIFDSDPEVHTSFLESTKKMLCAAELIGALHEYSVDLAVAKNHRRMIEIVSLHALSNQIFVRLTEGLIN